jgi:hypothetical protein
VPRKRPEPSPAKSSQAGEGSAPAGPQPWDRNPVVGPGRGGAASHPGAPRAPPPPTRWWSARLAGWRLGPLDEVRDRRVEWRVLAYLPEDLLLGGARGRVLLALGRADEGEPREPAHPLLAQSVQPAVQPVPAVPDDDVRARVRLADRPEGRLTLPAEADEGGAEAAAAPLPRVRAEGPARVPVLLALPREAGLEGRETRPHGQPDLEAEEQPERHRHLRHT